MRGLWRHLLFNRRRYLGTGLLTLIFLWTLTVSLYASYTVRHVLRGDISIATARIDNNGHNIASLEDQVNREEQAIAKLEAEVAALQARVCHGVLATERPGASPGSPSGGRVTPAPHPTSPSPTAAPSGSPSPHPSPTPSPLCLLGVCVTPAAADSSC